MLLLARHGQCAPNAAGLIVGRSDPPLTDVGKRQAVALGRAVASSVDRPGHRADREGARGAVRVVTSPLVRARATAEAICEALGIAPGDITVDERWVEIDYGTYEGLPAAALAREASGGWGKDLSLRAPGGESLADVAQRVRNACEEIASAASGSDARRDAEGDGHTIVVSHVSPIKAAVAWALGADDSVVWRMYLDVASLSTVVLPRKGSGPGALRRGPFLRSYNENAHCAAVP